MTDDERELCGESTDNTDSCQNYADSCPWHGEGESPDTGRPLALDDSKTRGRLLEAAEAGAYLKDCAKYARVSYDALRGVMKRYEEDDPDLSEEFREFCEEFNAREAKGTIGLLNEAKPEHVLSTKGYSKSQEIEHSGEIDGFNFTVNARDDS